jgi:electron transfer flavoprotein beta subunit
MDQPLKVLVAVKRVVDANVNVRPTADGTRVDDKNLKMSVNPFCEIAVEESVRWLERGFAKEAVLVSIGPEQCRDTLRSALAIGATRAIHVVVEEPLQPLAVAKLLAAVAYRERPDVILLGKQAIDDDCAQTGQMLSALLGCSLATSCSKVETADGDISTVCEVDAGQQMLRLTLPAVITVDLRLNTPRYPSLPGIMAAKKKPMEQLGAAELGVDISSRIRIVEVGETPRRQAGILVASAGDLVDRLRNEARVL